MTRAEAVQWIDASNTIFAVEFIKRSSGELRVMNCRRKCLNHLKGGPAAYNPEDHGLIVVFEMPKESYKAIPVDGLQRIKINGEWVPVSD